MSKTAVFITHRAKAGLRDQVIGVWERHFRPLVSTRSHDAYFYCLDEQDPDVVRVYQQYANSEAQAKLLASEGYSRYEQAIEPLLASPPEISLAAPAWVLPPG